MGRSMGTNEVQESGMFGVGLLGWFQWVHVVTGDAQNLQNILRPRHQMSPLPDELIRPFVQRIMRSSRNGEDFPSRVERMAGGREGAAAAFCLHDEHAERQSGDAAVAVEEVRRIS